MPKSIKSKEKQQVDQVDSNQTIDETDVAKSQAQKTSPKEINGPKGLEPTRYGDWESKGRCYDF